VATRLLTLTLTLLAACWGDSVVPPETPDFVPQISRPDVEPLFQQVVDGVTAEVYVVGECGTLIVTVPGFGEFAETLCDPPTTGVAGIGGVECAGVEGTACSHEIPPWFLATTHPGATSVCVDTGDAEERGKVIEARDGWWLSSGPYGGDVYPLDDNGERLDSLSNEIDDRVAAACGL
jgi:hypothetical protein